MHAHHPAQVGRCITLPSVINTLHKQSIRLEWTPFVIEAHLCPWLGVQLGQIVLLARRRGHHLVVLLQNLVEPLSPGTNTISYLLECHPSAAASPWQSPDAPYHVVEIHIFLQ